MKNVVSFIIVDDEEPARNLIAHFASKFIWLQNLGESRCGIDAIELISEIKPDLVFLDINLPDIKGVDLLKTLSNYQPNVIFTTAYEDFALKSFEYKVVDYLIKPITLDTFTRAVNKVKHWVALNDYKIPGNDINGGRLKEDFLPSYISDDSTSNETILNTSFIWVRNDKKDTKVMLNEIIFIEGLKDYVKIHTCSEMLVSHSNVSTMERKLDTNVFIRCHRSFIVNFNYIRSIHGNVIETVNHKELPIGTFYREDFIKRIQKT